MTQQAARLRIGCLNLRAGAQNVTVPVTITVMSAVRRAGLRTADDALDREGWRLQHKRAQLRKVAVVISTARRPVTHKPEMMIPRKLVVTAPPLCDRNSVRTTSQARMSVSASMNCSRLNEWFSGPVRSEKD